MDTREFKYQAITAVREYAQAHRSFTALDVRLAYPHISAPEPRAWGGVMRVAADKGYVRSTTPIMQEYPEGSGTNTSWAMQWESLIYLGHAPTAPATLPIPTAPLPAPDALPLPFIPIDPPPAPMPFTGGGGSFGGAGASGGWEPSPAAEVAPTPAYTSVDCIPSGSEL